MVILNWLGAAILIYLGIGILYMIFVSLYFKLMNRYTGGGFIDFGIMFSVVIAMLMWPLLLINFVSDEFQRYSGRR